MAAHDVDLAVLSDHDAWIEPHAALKGFRDKARALGVHYVQDEVTDFDRVKAEQPFRELGIF